MNCRVWALKEVYSRRCFSRAVRLPHSALYRWIGCCKASFWRATVPDPACRPCVVGVSLRPPKLHCVVCKPLPVAQSLTCLSFLLRYRTKDHRAGPGLFFAHTDRREHLARSQNTPVGLITTRLFGYNQIGWWAPHPNHSSFHNQLTW